MVTATCAVETCDRKPSSRGWCNSHYERWRKTGDVRADEPLTSPSATCIAAGCGQPTKAKGRYCSKHAARRWRTGTTDERVREYTDVLYHPRGYWLRRRPEHPLANLPGGRGYEHRMVLFDHIGPGRHACAYCSRTVEWGIDLHVDHIDNDPSNNAPSNLAACCAPCNARKGDGPALLHDTPTEA